MSTRRFSNVVSAIALIDALADRLEQIEVGPEGATLQKVARHNLEQLRRLIGPLDQYRRLTQAEQQEQGARFPTPYDDVDRRRFRLSTGKRLDLGEWHD